MKITNHTSTPINCACCGGNNGKIIYEGLTSIYSVQSWSVVECAECKNIITVPVPSAKLLDEIYSSTYLYKVHLLASNEKRFRSRSMAEYIRKISPGKNSKLLEAGCMYGYLLDELRNDYSVKGIEIGDEAVSFCKSKGLDVSDSSIENYLGLSNEKFDVIILSHVFEHLLAPDSVIALLRERLTTAGKIVISVPNSDSLCRKLFGKNWGWWQVPVHINHFRLSALQKLADRSGLKIEDARFKGGDSLMLLLNFINLFGFRGDGKAPGIFQKTVIRFFTFFFRYWYHLGNEELTVVLVRG